MIDCYFRIGLSSNLISSLLICLLLLTPWDMLGSRNLASSFRRRSLITSYHNIKRSSLLQRQSLEFYKFFQSSSRGFSQLSSQNKPDFLKESDAKYFEFQRLEKDIYQWWEKNGYFKPIDDVIEKDGQQLKRKKFVVPMPPPNVTGYLHMGHAIFIALQDIMTRFYRMRGFSTLWLPGTDHAGIATQLLVEKSLAKQGISRQSLGREAFLEKVWEWKNEKGDYIINQMKRLGASADWERQKFTLDVDMNEAVTESFLQLYEKGLIYRGSYLVNWSPNLQTAVSDLEVEYSEEEGKLYYFKYHLANSDEFIPVATTRPETILGDTAVCVHPEDPRYKHLIGKMVKVPMLNREIPVIADEYVDREFGTGALKITPAHDVNDYEIGKKHHLPMINIFNKDATVNQNGHQYTGLDRFICREKLWNDMKAANLVIKEEKHMQRVPRSQRGGEIIEPMISSQWFVKMDNMARKAIEAVDKKELTIIPERFEKIWFNWLDNIHDWCISRQLWWGHRIPVYYVKSVNGNKENNDNLDSTKFVVARNAEEALVKARAQFGDGITIEQDEDVLDTWFSSGLWPFATVGWPHALSDHNPSSPTTADYNKFYPASVLETGYDILFFWVARMVTMGIELTGRVPFHTIYMHGLVRDAQGQKMSKTKGNVIDPIDTIEQYGSDALRFALVTACSPGQDIPLSIERIESYRNFVNKLWNIGKYLQFAHNQYLGALPSSSNKPELGNIHRLLSEKEIKAFQLPERYIITRLHQVTEEVTTLIEEYQFHEGGKLLYDFIWTEFADWYVEISKFHLRRGATAPSTIVSSVPSDPADQAMFVLLYVMSHSLKLLHPYMPYVTETLFQLLPATTTTSPESIMMESWPTYDQSYLEQETSSSSELPKDKEAITQFTQIQSLIKMIRNVRSDYQVEQTHKIPLILYASSDFIEAVVQEKASVAFLAKLAENEIEFVVHERSSKQIDGYEFGETSLKSLLEKKGQCIHTVIEDQIEIYIPQRKLFQRDKELQRMSKQLEKLTKDLTVLNSKLNNEKFYLKAPKELIEEVKNKSNDYQLQYQTLKKSYDDLLKEEA